MITPLLLALALVAQDDPDPAEPVAKGAAFQQVGTSVQSLIMIGATANTKYTVRRGNDGSGIAPSAPACAPTRSRLVFTTKTGGAIVHLTQTTTVAFPSDFGTQYANRVTDAAGPSGNATGPDLPIAGSVAEERVDFDAVYNAPGGRVKGVCTTPISCMGVTSYVPCRVGGDCTDWGAGSTCDTTSSQSGRLYLLKNKGAVGIVFQGDTANTQLTIVRQK